MRNDEVIVSTRNVFKSFGKQNVLKDINLEIIRGEIFGLLGPSGAGKTTLVKQLVGLDLPTSGENFVFQKRMPSLSLIERIGYMAQSDALYGELSAKENLEFFAALYGLKGKRRQTRIKEVMEIVELSEHLNKLVSNYSGGMKRRLSLAIALLHEPELLILDEPTVGIDPVLRKNIWNSFYDLKKKGTTLIVTTHVMDEAEKCDRLGMIRNGELIAVGTPDELKINTNTATLEEAFLVYGGVES
ncbi:ABC transporter ATP-binding protein [Bacillus methanolicus]|uniref:ABC transporter related protein n=1 Tax=Bacillus methanolicus (strain MGA3 / ATCC 53907) TaxID=796606 RepID=I3EBR7_BACMM|nr:ABC transporter ATP-binding protein [Bacillus methanolicus]AIE61619.1 ABC transporter related protein [Bacillus methanolicus MGA3]EIJ83938.1 ABC transporter related protein [Bacillus methanolicus MGA3]